jgi:hypothetical protein
MKRNKSWGDKTIAGPANRSAKYSNGKRRELKAIETRARRQGKRACQEQS